MRKILLIFNLMMCFLLIGTLTLAQIQEKKVSGKVTTSDGTPIPNVSIQNTDDLKKGTTSDQNGEFTFIVPIGTQSVRISAVGYDPVNLDLVEGKNYYTVILTQIITSNLTDVVVVGYGTQQKKDVTGSIATIKGDILKNVAAPSIDKSLEGQMAGVQVSTPSGILGQPARILIRGTNSISSGSDPLYVVDGVPYVSGNQGSATSYNPISDINPNDIESIDVLKDGAATAIYGSRAANGVILITTKRGKFGKAQINYNDWFAAASPSKRFDLLNSDQFIKIANEKLENYGDDGPAHSDSVNTDWQNIIFKTGFQTQHSLSLSGATDQTNYYVSMGYTNMIGSIVSNTLRKYDFRAKLEQKALDNHLTVGANVGISYNINYGLNAGGGNALSGNITAALVAPPNVSEFNSDGSWNLAPGGQLGQGSNDQVVDNNYPNIGYVLKYNTMRTQALNITGDAFARVNIIDGLNLTTQIGINYMNVEDYTYWNPVHGDGRGYNGIIDQSFAPTLRYNWQNTIDYSKTFNSKHQINIVAGYEIQGTQNRYLDGNGTGLSDVFFGQQGNIISSTLANQFYGGDISNNRLSSMFGRISYSYNDKYLISGSLRHDKLSSLPWDGQGSTMPGGSIGWRISKEGFWQNSRIVDVVNDFKIRASLAKVGNTNIGDFPYAGLFSPVQYGDWSGVYYSRMGNPDLRFETSKKKDIGADLSFFKSRLQFTADYYVDNIDNLILAVPTPPSLGVPGNSYSANVGKMSNKGWEFSINSLNISTDKFKWNTSFNISFNKNKVITLVNHQSIINAYNITAEGLPIGSFYGYQFYGVNTQNGNPIWTKADGTYVQYDASGNPNYGYYVYDPKNPTDESKESSLSASDKKVMGSANPKWFGGLSNSFSYKSFDLGFMLTFAGGNNVYNITRQETLMNTDFENNSTEILKRWTAVGQKTSVPKLWYGEDNGINNQGSLDSRFLEKGDFLRMQSLTLGYTVSPSFLSHIKVNSLRIYAQAQNLFIITGYKGLDPELANSVTSNQTPGLDYNVNPIPRTYTFGINLSF